MHKFRQWFTVCERFGAGDNRWCVTRRFDRQACEDYVKGQIFDNEFCVLATVTVGADGKVTVHSHFRLSSVQGVSAVVRHDANLSAVMSELRFDEPQEEADRGDVVRMTPLGPLGGAG